MEERSARSNQERKVFFRINLNLACLVPHLKRGQISPILPLKYFLSISNSMLCSMGLDELFELKFGQLRLVDSCLISLSSLDHLP